MAELIDNGFFDDDDLTPWERCAHNELGEAWICLEEEEPTFPRMAWHFTEEGSLTDLNYVFLSDYNMRLTSDDGIKQELPRYARASGDFSLWAHCTPLDSAAGELYAFVCYQDHTFNYGKLTRDQLRNFVGPTRLIVEVQDKTIEKVVICTVNATASWFVNGISLPGVDSKTLRQPGRSVLYIENRLAALESKVDQLFHIIVKGLPPGEGKSVPGNERQEGKKKGKQKGKKQEKKQRKQDRKRKRK